MKQLSVLCLVIILIAGCATYHPKPLDPLRTAAAFEARTLDNPGLRKYVETNLRLEIPWPPQSWDFTLLSLAAMYYHPDLDVARARQKSAEASVITADASPNPSFTFTPEFASNPPAGVSPWILSPSLDIPIETAGKRGYRLNSAQYLSRAAALETAAVTWRVRSRLRKALLSLFAASRGRLIVERQAKTMAEMVMLFRQRLAAGEISENEVNAAETLLARTRLQLQSMQARENKARASIASSIGLTVNALERVAISTEAMERVPSLPAPPLPDLRRRALLIRPDVLAALAKYDAAESSLQLEIAKQYPDVNVAPGYTWDQGQNKWIFGFTVTLPVLNRNEGPIAEADARRGEAEAGFVALQARIINEIEEATATSDAALQKLKTADAILTAQNSRYLSTQAMFDAGEIDRDELLNARLAYHDSELFRLNGLVDLQDALGLLEDALHYPLAPPPPSTNPGPVPEDTRTAK